MVLAVCLGGFEGYSYEQGSCKVRQITKVLFSRVKNMQSCTAQVLYIFTNTKSKFNFESLGNISATLG